MDCVHRPGADILSPMSLVVLAALDPNVWFPSIVTGLLTGALAIGGIVYAQRQTAARDEKEREYEQRAWTREQKRAAHAAFLAEQRRLDQWMMKVTRMGTPGVETPTEGWYHSLSALLVDVQVFGSQDAAIAARRLYRATVDLESGAVGAMMKADELFEAYRRHVQRDLDLAETELPEWGRDDESPWDQVGRITYTAQPLDDHTE